MFWFALAYLDFISFHTAAVIIVLVVPAYLFIKVIEKIVEKQ